MFITALDLLLFFCQWSFSKNVLEKNY